MTKNAKKYIVYISILVVVTVLAVYFVMKQDPKAVIDVILSCNVGWLLASIGVVMIYFILEGIILTILARMYRRKFPFYKGLLNMFIGTFFSNITPSSSGGQFAQAYTFSKQGVKVTNAASILFMHFILYQIVMVLFSFVIFIFKYNQLESMTSHINVLGFDFSVISISLIGFVINTFVIVALFLLAFSEKLHQFIVTKGISFLHKIKIIKNKEEQVIKLNTKVETFRLEFKRLTQNWPVLLITSILLLLRIIVISSVPYFLAKSMGLEFSSSNEIVNIIDTTSMTWLISSITQMVPIPGGSGGAELVFQNLFGGTFFTNATHADISALVLLWRSVTFYLGLIIGFIVFVTYRESPKKESFLHGDNRTLLELEVINLDNERKKTLILNEYVEPTIVSVEDIENRFKSLKEDLKKQLEKNEEMVNKELDKKGK
ncbi:MAG: flippase-like domain-containing protein [Erysipelotrichaceae bacterium]|nr:flippase-like domain-containing protein [Erysipelotrichaceae bacterium]